MPTTMQLRGTLSLGGASFSVEAAVTTENAAVFSGSTNTPIDFTGTVGEVLGNGYLQLPDDFPSIVFQSASVTISETAFELRATSDTTWSNPFGVLNGLSFGALTLTLHAGDRTDLSLAATVAYGTLVLPGTLVFSGGTLMVAAASLSQTLSIGDFLSWSLGGSVSWNELLPIAFGPQQAGGNARIYYAKQATGDYRSGFNIDQAAIDILGFRANVRLNVAGGRVTVVGSLPSAIDFGFLRLSGTSAGTGPDVNVVAGGGGPPSFSLSSRVTFLGADFGTATIGVQQASAGTYQLAGSITSNGPIAPFGTASIAFTWSRVNGFRVESWSIAGYDGSAAMNFTELLNDTSSGSCESFVETMFREGITTRFDLTAGMASPAGDTPGTLTIVFRGTYTIGVAGVQDVLTVPLPADLPVELSTPEEFTFQAVAEKLHTLLANAASSMVRQIVNDPVRSATFFGIVAVQVALPQVIARVLCRSWTPPAPPLPPLPPPPTIPIILPPIPVAGGGADPPAGPQGLSLTFTASSSGGTLQAAWSAVTGATSYTAALRDVSQQPLSTMSGEATTATFAVSESWPATTYAVNVYATTAPGVTAWSDTVTIERLGAPSQPALAQNAQDLLLTWSANGAGPPWNAATGYDYAVYAPTGLLFASGSTDASTLDVSLPLPQDAAEGTYVGVVRATGGSAAIASQWSAEATVFVTPATVSGLIVSVTNDATPSGPIYARCTSPATEAVTEIDPQATVKLLEAPIAAFAVWQTAPATTTIEFVDEWQVTINTSEGTTTVRYQDIVNRTLPGWFSVVERKGALAGGAMRFADDLTSSEMTTALTPYFLNVAELIKVIPVLYPGLTQLELAAASLTAGFGIAGGASAIAELRQFFAPTSPVTASSVAVAVSAAAAAAGQPVLPSDVTAALLQIFPDIDAPTLAGALVAAFPITTITADVLLPLVTALAATFTMAEAAQGCTAALPELDAAPLAIALATVYQATMTALAYAQSLRAGGLTAQQAAPLIDGSYPPREPDAFVQLLTTAFPDTTGTPLLLAWCFAAASQTADAATAGLAATGLQPDVIAAALKTVYPQQAATDVIAAVKAVYGPASKAAQSLTTQLSDLTSTQIGWLLITRFYTDATEMTQALASALWKRDAAAAALQALWPLMTGAEIGTVLDHVYGGTS